MTEAPENVNVTSLKDEFLECPVCVEYYNHTNRRPRLLKNCLHALCTECLDQLIQKEGRGQLTCPLCRHVEKVKGKASSLPADHVRSKLVDFLHMKQQKKIKCTNCPDGNDADGRCDECQWYLCKDCINAHKRNHLSRGHNISSIEDALKVPIREFSQGHFCPKHPKGHIEFYCSTDEELCCVSCTVVDHKGHEFEKIQDVAAQRKNSIQESLKDLYKTKTDLQKRQKSMTTKRNSVEQMKKESERNINKMIDDMKLQLDQRRNQLLSELQQESSAMLSAIEKTSASYDTTLAVIESIDTYFIQTKEKADDVEMLQMYPAIKKSVDALQNQPVAADVRISEDRLKFSSTQKAVFNRFVPQLGAFGRQAPQAPPAPRAMTFTQQAVCTVAQGKTLSVKLYKGDVRSLRTDVIVRLVQQDLSPCSADSPGPELSDQLERIRGEKGQASYGSVVVTDVGCLPKKKIFNLVFNPFDIRKSIITCLCEAANRKLTSIAFPWMYSTIPAVRSFDQSVTGGSLQEVHIVTKDDEELSTMEKQIKKVWPQGSKIDQEDINIIKKHLYPSAGTLLSNPSQ